MEQKIRRSTHQVAVGTVTVGSEHPVVIQSMTDTPTADESATYTQTRELITAGSEFVRWTVNDDNAARAVPRIIERLRSEGYRTPIIGDFHFNGHTLLKKHPDCAQALSKYRINPGNVGRGERHDQNFARIIEMALRYGKPVRIGVNWGSLDQELLTTLMDENAASAQPKSSRDIMLEAMIQSALSSAALAHNIGLPENRIILSVKMSVLQDMLAVNSRLAQRCAYPLHLGLTEAGGDVSGITASAAALGILLQQGIGDTIRVSLTPQPGVRRSREVEVCKHLLQSMGLRYFQPRVTSCPGCGRTKSDFFQILARDITDHIEHNMPRWRKSFPGIEKLKIAVMGCVVNGPGESRHADIGISLPGTSEQPIAPVYIDGKQYTTLRGDTIRDDFIDVLETYLARKFKREPTS